MSTKLGNGEVQLWSFAAQTKGFFRVKVVISLVVTNFRIMRIDQQNNKVLGYFLFTWLDDVIVMNTHRVSRSTGYAIYTGYRTRYGTRSSSGTSKTVGYIVFIINGQKVSWGGIPDPTGLKNFIKSIKKTMYDPLAKLATKTNSSRAGAETGIPCPNCNQQNPKNSQFCNGCGSKLLQICSKCNQSNPIDASFCSKCGSQLGINYSVSASENRPTLSDQKHSEVIEPSFYECILPEYNVKNNYPSTWTRRDDTYDALKVMFQSPKESPTDPFLDALGVTVDETLKMNLQKFIEVSIANVRQTSSDFKLLESTPTTLSGLRAHQIVYLANNLKWLVVATVRKKVFYWLQYCSEAEKYQKFLSSVEQMISSFEFL